MQSARPTVLLVTLAGGAALAGCSALAGTPGGEAGPRARPLRVTEPPASVREALGLDPFYRKHVSVGGLPVMGSGKVSDYALLEAAYLVDRMLAKRPDVLEELVKAKVRCVVMAPTEFTTDVPEHSNLKPPQFWDKRCRGVGATRWRPAVSAGEENLLCYPGDPYRHENILIHEFAHTIHEMGLKPLDKRRDEALGAKAGGESFDSRLEDAYREAMAAGRWKGKYSAVNRGEYWAEGAQFWFEAGSPGNCGRGQENTRDGLKAYDASLARLLTEVFGDDDWRYERPAERERAGHLEGYDPEGAPRFSWPPELVEWFRKHQAEKRRSQKKKPERK